tara:strand:- start:1032 stop:1820 length:789 start_codon:yes stop_codon:yes gene_type:complete
MKKKHIIKSGKRLVKKKIQSIKESKQPKFLFEGRLEDLRKSWDEFVNGARREGKETTEAAKILAKIINRKDVTEEDKKFLKEQSKDLARIVAVMGLGAVSMALPIALEKVLNKWNISIMPKSHSEEDEVEELNESTGNLLYSAVVLDDDDQDNLIMFVENFVEIPINWKKIAHHMTMGFKQPVPQHLRDDIGKTVQLTVKEIGVSEDAIAVKVDGYPSNNKIPHVTIAIPKDGKPYNSNLITDWKPVDEEIIIKGKVREIYS